MIVDCIYVLWNIKNIFLLCLGKIYSGIYIFENRCFMFKVIDIEMSIIYLSIVVLIYFFVYNK